VSTAHAGAPSLNRLAVSATTHCLTGCAIGEVLGLVLATWWGWNVLPSIGRGSLALGLGIAWVVAFPVNRWLLSRGQGHALVTAYHAGHG
jgi:hypothetical protein